MLEWFVNFILTLPLRILSYALSFVVNLIIKVLALTGCPVDWLEETNADMGSFLLDISTRAWAVLDFAFFADAMKCLIGWYLLLWLVAIGVRTTLWGYHQFWGSN